MATIHYITERRTTVTRKDGSGGGDKRKPSFEILGDKDSWVLVDGCMPRTLAKMLKAVFHAWCGK